MTEVTTLPGIYDFALESFGCQEVNCWNRIATILAESAGSTTIGVGVETSVADTVANAGAGAEAAVAVIAGAEAAVAVIAGAEIAVADIVADAGAGVEVAVADIADDDVVIAVPTLFNFADTPCCNNDNTLG